MKTNQGDIELQEIQVNKAVEDNRCECWKYNVGEQFPMKSVKQESGKCIVEVGPPHEGYSIETSIINWKMEGESKILSKDNIVIATLFFVNGVATGPCKLYDESGLLYYEGYLENGYRQGSGKEYDVSGNVVSEGFYDKGKRIKMVRMKEMKRYWKKYDEKGRLLSVSKRDIYGREKGICYFYDEEGKICRISEWKKGTEIGDSGYCKIYDENRKTWYIGYYSNGIQHGYGTEYDDHGNRIFEGFYNEGKKMPIYRMVGNGEYWNEYDNKGKLICISKRNIYGRKEGKCYSFDENEEIRQVSLWENGKEISVLKKFNGSNMIEYKNGIRFYEGSYRDSINEDYPYEGEGKEYAADGVTLVYRGGYRNGQRHGKGLTYRRMRVKRKGYWVNGVKKESTRNICILLCISIVMLYITSILSLNLWWIYFFSVLPHIIFIVMLILLFILIKLRSNTSMDNEEPFFVTLSEKPNDHLVIRDYCYSNVDSFIPPQYQYKSITVKSDCFPNVSDVYINGLSKLEKMNIEHNSFTRRKNSYGKSISKVFQVSNCERLQWIEIGQYSFSDFAGVFKLRNLPCLQYLIIGLKDLTSNNFVYSSFVVRSNE